MISVETSVCEGRQRDPNGGLNEKVEFVEATIHNPNPDERKQESFFVGLARVRVPTNIREHVENDVTLEMAIQEVVETLYIHLDSCHEHASINYVGELYNLAWDLACAADKHTLKINIISGAISPHAWEELFNLQELGAVYGNHGSVQPDTKWLPRTGLFPVAYRSPEPLVSTYFGPGITYFHENDFGPVQHTHVIVNGTFDHLHGGHRNLLSLAAGICTERLVVGITAAQDILDAMPFAHLIEPLAVRKQHVRDFLATVSPSVEVVFVDVFDKWGPAASWDDIRALVVTSTSNITDLDAHVRQRRDLAPELPMLLRRVIRRTHRSTLSSRRIRALLAARLE